MKIEILSFSPKEIKELIFKKINEDEKYKDYEVFRKIIEDVIDDEFVCYQAASAVTFGMVDYENTVGAQNDVEQYDLASFLLTYRDIFTDKKYYKHGFKYEMKEDKCSIYMEYEKLFEEEDHFDYKIQFAIRAFKAMMQTEFAYQKMVKIIYENTLKKVYYAFTEALKEAGNENSTPEILTKNIFYIVAEQKANEQYIKYLKREESKKDENNKK